jgi:hypothetical protein
MKKLFILLFASILLMGCSENYSNGERIGLVTKFSEQGLVWKSWEGHLNLTQTGMNSSMPFDFSLDNDRREDYPQLLPIIDSASRHGWKVRMHYHQVFGWNWFSNRGKTDYFVDSVLVLDRNPVASAMGGGVSRCEDGKRDTVYTGIRDTIYVVVQEKR